MPRGAVKFDIVPNAKNRTATKKKRFKSSAKKAHEFWKMCGLEGILINRDKLSGMVTIHHNMPDRQTAKTFLNDMIAQIEAPHCMLKGEECFEEIKDVAKVTAIPIVPRDPRNPFDIYRQKTYTQIDPILITSSIPKKRGRKRKNQTAQEDNANVDVIVKTKHTRKTTKKKSKDNNEVEEYKETKTKSKYTLRKHTKKDSGVKKESTVDDTNYKEEVVCGGYVNNFINDHQTGSAEVYNDADINFMDEEYNLDQFINFEATYDAGISLKQEETTTTSIYMNNCEKKQIEYLNDTLIAALKPLQRLMNIVNQGSSKIDKLSVDFDMSLKLKVSTPSRQPEMNAVKYDADALALFNSLVGDNPSNYNENDNFDIETYQPTSNILHGIVGTMADQEAMNEHETLSNLTNDSIFSFYS